MPNDCGKGCQLVSIGYYCRGSRALLMGLLDDFEGKRDRVVGATPRDGTGAELRHPC